MWCTGDDRRVTPYNDIYTPVPLILLRQLSSAHFGLDLFFDQTWSIKIISKTEKTQLYIVLLSLFTPLIRE